MSPDDGLRALFRLRLPPSGQWTTIETGGRGDDGVPDAFYQALGHVGVWVEFKSVRRGRAVQFRPGQVGWMLTNYRMGGHAVIAVRRRCPPGPRVGLPVDELHMFDGSQVKLLATSGLPPAHWDRVRTPSPTVRLGVWRGGPARWDWREIRGVLVG